VRVDTARPFLNIARQGEDLGAGDIVIDSPCIGEPAIIGLLASLGQKELTVARLPKVALITTGNEIVPVETQPGPVQIRNSNRWLLQAFLKKWQIDPWLYRHVPDDKALLRTAMEEALSADMVILCGGVSAGDADYVPGILEEAGVTRLFHKLAIKPGKPVWCGIGSRETMVFALPGNPFSCLVGFILLIQPYLQACFGLPGEAHLGLPLGTAKKKHTPLDEFFPVRVHGAPARLLPVSLNGSGDIRLGMQANALALHPAGMPDLEEGANIIYFPL
jgi:molybdopterin molybdotransferase